ncbi:MAG: cytochrome c biogenesis protein [Oscillochloridaceae bacterium]|nr:cytochrome c biogenesis protein [Chloroflexaceae bacterium]MDW8389671.1 cytochrome c biogenesis protein [Oscillochloridaceae bacterium]
MALRTLGKLLIGLWMAGVMIATFVVIPSYQGLGDAGRIVILHVPTAWVAVVAFTVSAVFSGLYLWRRRLADDHRATAAAESGLLFTLLATLTGMIFSQVAWGIFWNWDPRQVTIFILLLIYAALFVLRAAIDDPDRRRTLASVYSLFAFVTMPFLMFVAPRMAESTLHPNCAFIRGSDCDGITLQVGHVGVLGDQKVQLLDLSQNGDLVTARVQVSAPGLASEAVLTPGFDLAAGAYTDRPAIPGQRFTLALEEVDIASGTVRLNIEAPGTGLLANQRTLWVFLAANLGFTALFVWMFLVRSQVLDLETAVEQRKVAWA